MSLKRRSIAGMTTRPIEVLPHRFFLLVVRDPPCHAVNQLGLSSPPVPLSFPRTPGVAFVELEAALWAPRDHEQRLDAAHTVRFCRYMNAMRRKYLGAAKPVDADDRTHTGRSIQVHFYMRSRVRGDERELVQLVCRWRLLCVRLSSAEALAPFQQYQSLVFPSTTIDRAAGLLAGIAKGVALGLLSVQRYLDDDQSDDLARPHPQLVRISRRFLIFASPLDATVPPVTPPAEQTREAQAPQGATLLGQPHPDCIPSMGQAEDARPAPHRLTVAQLTPLLKQQRVIMVVKLNAAPRYDDQLIIRSSIDHLDLSGQSDSNRIDRGVVSRFLESCENAPPHGVVAVHSSSGLGRAAFCVACFLMKHLQFSAVEAVGWLRFCCPGAIPLWYEGELERMQTTLWREGDEFRRQQAEDEASNKSSGRAMPSLDDLAVTVSGTRLLSQISIGQMSLVRDSLLGTKEKAKENEAGVAAKSGLVAHRSSGSLKEFQAAQQLIASDATLVRRRPLTQGAAGRRRLFDHHFHRASDAGGSVSTATRADFSAIRKFLHHSGTSSSSSSSPAESSGSQFSNGTPLRPPSTAPDRTASGAMRSSSKADVTFD